MGFCFKVLQIHSGWFDGFVENEGKRVDFSVSYFDCNVLKLLTENILNLIKNFGEKIETENIDTGEIILKKNNVFEVFWTSEPEGYKWFFEIDDDKKININFITYSIAFKDFSIEKENCLSFKIDIVDFISEVVESMKKIIVEYGLINYKREMIDFDFPLSDYFLLKTVLDENYLEKMNHESDFEDIYSKIEFEREKQLNILQDLLSI